MHSKEKAREREGENKRERERESISALEERDINFRRERGRRDRKA